jgi:pimeloyl-ACP methyl ester carboxylesterase
VIVDELHTLLTEADIMGPYVLVGHSLAGRYVRLFAQRYPTQVAGMVLVDARHEYSDQVSTPEQKALEDRQQVASERLMGVLGRLGAMRFAGARLLTAFLPGYGQLAPENLAAVTILQSKPTRIAASRS